MTTGGSAPEESHTQPPLLTPGRLYRAMAKSAAGRYLAHAVRILSLPVLARLFAPEDFGVLAAIAVFTTFFSLVSEFGLGPAIINLDQVGPRQRDGIFSFTLIVAIVLSLLFYALGGTIVRFYAMPDLATVIPYASVALFFSAATVVPNAALLRDQHFLRLGQAAATAEAAGAALAVGLSFVVAPLDALASKLAAGPLCAFVLTLLYSRKTSVGVPRPGAAIGAIKPLLSFSAYQFGFNFINFFSRNLDNMLIGRTAGAAALGVYEKAYALMTLPLTLLTFAMTPAMQPVLRHHANQPDRIDDVYRSVVRVLGLVGVGVAAVVVFVAESIVYVVLGPQWNDVVPIIRILGLAIPVQVVLSTSGSVFQALGRPNWLFVSGALSAMTMIAAIILGIAQQSIIVLSWALVGAFCVNFVQAYYLLYTRVLHLPMLPFLRSVALPALGTSALVAYQIVSSL